MENFNTYQHMLFNGFSYASRTIGHPFSDKIYKLTQKIDRQMKSACRKIREVPYY